MDKGIVQTIFKDHFESYRKTRVLSRRQYHAAGSIMTCRTADQGCHINACPNGDYEVLMHNSCKHRSCPLCGSTETQLWLERRKRQALNCRYFHVTITISHDLHPLWRRNRKVFTNLMMRASWHSLKELLQDFKWLNPKIAVNFVDFSLYTKLWSSITGHKMSGRQFLKAGERVHVLERYMNTREGISRKDDTLPDRFLKETRASDAERKTVPLEKMLDHYYKVRGFDDSGIPTEKTLKKLGIID